MSIAGFPESDRFYRKSTHRRNDSGELDVFEATRYFSGGNESAGFNSAAYSQKNIREERQGWGGRRMSLDVPTTINSFPSQSHRMEKQVKDKKYKQPRSPGGRLASFLNSLFHQAASKKKKSNKSSTQSTKDEEESPGGRRKRRSSVSHFQSVSSAEMKSMYSSSSSGFRTPPPYVNTPTKGYKDIRNYSDDRHVVPLSRCKANIIGPEEDAPNYEKRNMDLAWLDEKFKFIDVVSETKNNILEKDRIWASEKNGRKIVQEMDDGGESDSSSDLFELQNYDLGVYSSGLPVYETTHMESIKRGAPIANGRF